MKLIVITGACGAGKSTIKDEMERRLDSSQYACIDTDEKIEQRLRDRPKDRGFDSDEAIRPQIEYNQWFRNNKGKFPLFIDNSDMSVEETGERIVSFITGLPI